jgi:transposase InsO family protein
MNPNGELWLAGITYICLRAEFFYVAVVLDAFSRSLIGRAMGGSLKVGSLRTFNLL